MFRVFVFALLIAGIVFAGSISGEIIYPPASMGLYIALAMSPAEIDSLMGGTLDFDSVAASTPVIEPGEYSIPGDFDDDVPYTVFSIIITSLDPDSVMPAAGDPMGLYPEPVYTDSGVATDIDVTLDTVANLGGTIHYSGDIDSVKIAIYDIQLSLDERDTTLEEVHYANDTFYSITVKTGVKMALFFDDLNGNDEWDEADEAGTYFTDPDPEGWGNLLLAAGGDRFATGIDVEIPPVAVDECVKSIPKMKLSCAPNPFNAIAVIEYATQKEAVLAITDISGRTIYSEEVSGSGEMTVGNNLATGTYLVSLKSGNRNITKKIVIMK